MISEKVQVATTMRPIVAMLTSGMDRSVVAMKRGNARGARGAGHPLYDPFIVANRQRDEPLGCSGGRQPSSGGTSRMTGDRLVRICEGSRVKFLRSTRRGLKHVVVVEAILVVQLDPVRLTAERACACHVGARAAQLFRRAVGRIVRRPIGHWYDVAHDRAFAAPRCCGRTPRRLRPLSNTFAPETSWEQ